MTPDLRSYVLGRSGGALAPASDVVSCLLGRAAASGGGTDTRIFGAVWDGASASAWTRTDDAADFADPVPYVAGATSCGSPFDTISPWKDMTVVEDEEAGTMVRIPKFYYQLTQTDGGGVSLKISSAQHAGFKVCPACMDRGDGRGERDFVLVGRYHCASDYKSKTGVSPIGSITRATARTNIHALGTDVWLCDFLTRFTIWLLYLVEFAHFNSQDKIGYGCGNGSSSEDMGYTDTMPYHTGTMLSSRSTYGVGTQYRNIEGLWDNILDFLSGCYNNENGMYIISNPANDSDSSGGTLLGLPVAGWPTALTVADAAGATLFYPSAGGGSRSGNNYVCDYWFFLTSYPIIANGGSYYADAGSGMFGIVHGWVGAKAASYGARSMKLP